MDKTFLDLIGDFSQWKGDVYRLVVLVVEKQKEQDRAKLVDAGFPETAEVLKWACCRTAIGTT